MSSLTAMAEHLESNIPRKLIFQVMNALNKESIEWVKNGALFVMSPRIDKLVITPMSKHNNSNDFSVFLDREPFCEENKDKCEFLGVEIDRQNSPITITSALRKNYDNKNTAFYLGQKIPDNTLKPLKQANWPKKNEKKT